MANLLIVDDSEKIIDSYRYHFREVAGWNVETATNGQDAITILNQKGKYFDAVLLDKNMPGKVGGYAVVEWMFNQELLDDICVVLFTGYPEVGSAVDTLVMGVWQYLVKEQLTPSRVESLIAPGIARKRLHRVRREIWSHEDGVKLALARIEEIVRRTIAPAKFHVYFLSPYLRYARDLSIGEETPLPPLRDRLFVKRIMEGAEFVKASNAEETSALQPLLEGAKTLMAVPVHHGYRDLLGVMHMESETEAAFDPRWQEVLAYFADTISITQLIHEKEGHVKAEAARKTLEDIHFEVRHRIKNSLGIIEQSAAELLKPEEKLGPVGRERVGFIQAHRRRISGVLAEMAEISAGGSDIPPKRDTFDLSQVVRAVINELGAHIDGDTRVAILGTGFGTSVAADEDSVHDILMCLINNAIEAIAVKRRFDGLDQRSADTSNVADTLMQPYQVVCSFETREEEVELKVTDNGIGFGEDTAKRLFKALFTTKRELKTEGERGIGLFSSHRSVTRMGGRLEGASQGPYQGAVFTLVLPRPKAAGELSNGPVP